MVSIHSETGELGPNAPVTPARQVWSAATSPRESPGINAGYGEDAKPGHGNGIRYEEGEHEETLDDLMVLSPAHRVREKAPTPLVLKRSQKYCQKDDSVFSRGEPGEPVRKATDQE